MLGVVRSQTPETSKNLSTRHPAFSGGEASNNHWLTVIVTRFTSCCQTTGRGLGCDLRVALVLLGTKTNFSILPRERSSPSTDHAAEREEDVEKPEFRTEEAQLHKEINLVSSGGERSRHGQAREPGGFPGSSCPLGNPA